MRREELEEVFTHLYKELNAFTEDHERPARLIRDAARQDELGDFWKPFEKNMSPAIDQTPYELVRGIEAIVIDPTDRQKQVQATRSHQSVTSRDVPHVDWRHW